MPTVASGWSARPRARIDVEPRLAGVHVRDPLAREGAGLDVSEDRLHLVTDVLVDHAPPARVVAELGGVRDDAAHVLETALVDQVDDQLHLVQALVVGALGLVAGLDERLEAGADQLGSAAAQDGLLAEEVGLGLLAERRLEDPGATGADPDGVGEREVACAPARVLLDGDQRGCPVPLGEEPPDDVAGALSAPP